MEIRCICLHIEKYVVENIISLWDERDISKYRLSQLFQEGNPENLTDKQKEVLKIWNNLSTNEQETVMSMPRGLRKQKNSSSIYIGCPFFIFMR